MNLHIIVAGGTGSRFGASLPKQYCLLEGRPVLFRAIDAIRRAASPDDEVMAVIAPAMLTLYEELAEAHAPVNAAVLPVGGVTRFDTVASALRATSRLSPGVITVHDGARPIPDADMIRRVIAAAASPGSPGAIPSLPLTDSIRAVTPDGLSRAVDRSQFRAVQTPQAFPASLLRDAYAAADPTHSYTDDASVTEAFLGRPPLLVEGHPSNIKITNPRDLLLASALLHDE